MQLRVQIRSYRCQGLLFGLTEWSASLNDCMELLHTGIRRRHPHEWYTVVDFEERKNKVCFSLLVVRKFAP